jgi:hypothetical protein
MEEKERDDIVSILREVQEIIEDGVGATGSSLIKDQLVLHLAGTLLHRYWFDKKKEASPFDFGLKSDSASEIAFRVGKGACLLMSHLQNILRLIAGKKVR